MSAISELAKRAQDPTLNEQAMRKLARNRSPTVRRAVALNPKCPRHILSIVFEAEPGAGSTMRMSRAERLWREKVILHPALAPAERASLLNSRLLPQETTNHAIELLASDPAALDVRLSDLLPEVLHGLFMQLTDMPRSFLQICHRLAGAQAGTLGELLACVSLLHAQPQAVRRAAQRLWDAVRDECPWPRPDSRVWIAWTTLSVHDLIEIAFTATELDEGQWEVAASLLSDGLTPAEAIMAAESVSLSPGK